MSSDMVSQLRQKIGGGPQDWSVSEIGDGNVNFIFRLQGPKGQVLMKQAVPYLRIVGESWPLSLKRNFFEFRALQTHSKLAPAYMPEVFSYNESTSSMIMEFLDDHLILRKGMMAGTEYPNFSEHISDYMAQTLFFTSDLALNAGEKKELMQLFCENIDLCKITEDLIFTDPYRKAPQNHWTTPELDSDVLSLQTDVPLKIAATEMKAKFLTHAQALIHGDLHSGSIMVNAEETKVIDPEFAFFGPMGFDMGLLFANFFMSYFSQFSHEEKERNQYENWILRQIEEVWKGFAAKFSKLWDSDLKGDYLAPQFSEGEQRKQIIQTMRKKYLQELFADSIRFTGCEMIRRIVGLAHVADLEQIKDPKTRAMAERRCLRMAREIMVNHSKYTEIEHLTQLAKSMRIQT